MIEFNLFVRKRTRIALVDYDCSDLEQMSGSEVSVFAPDRSFMASASTVN